MITHNTCSQTIVSCLELLFLLLLFVVCVSLKMISAERVMAYSKLDPEASLETLPPQQPPAADWPREGSLSLTDVAFRYSTDLPLVLKNLSFSISPSEKVS